MTASARRHLSLLAAASCCCWRWARGCSAPSISSRPPASARRELRRRLRAACRSRSCSGRCRSRRHRAGRAARVRDPGTGRFPSRSDFMPSCRSRRRLQQPAAAILRDAERAGRARRRTSSTTSTRRGGPSRSTTSRCGRISGDALLTRDDIARNSATLENVRLWTSSRCSTRSGRSRKSARTTTSPPSTTTGIAIDGALRQVMLSARELNSASLPNADVDQRTLDVHAWLRPDARTGQPGDQRRPAGAVRSQSAPRDDRI